MRDGAGVWGSSSEGAGVTGGSVLSFLKKRKNQRKAKVGGMLPPRGGYFFFVHELFLILSSKSILSNGKEKNEQCTSASLPCVKGGGPLSGGRIVSTQN